MSYASTDNQRHSVPYEAARHLSRAILLWGGLAWLFATVQYASWSTPHARPAPQSQP